MSSLFSKPKTPTISAPAVNVNVDAMGLNEADAARRRAALRKQGNQTLFGGAGQGAGLGDGPSMGPQQNGGTALKSLLG